MSGRSWWTAVIQVVEEFCSVVAYFRRSMSWLLTRKLTVLRRTLKLPFSAWQTCHAGTISVRLPVTSVLSLLPAGVLTYNLQNLRASYSRIFFRFFRKEIHTLQLQSPWMCENSWRVCTLERECGHSRLGSGQQPFSSRVLGRIDGRSTCWKPEKRPHVFHSLELARFRCFLASERTFE